MTYRGILFLVKQVQTCLNEDRCQIQIPLSVRRRDIAVAPLEGAQLMAQPGWYDCLGNAMALCSSEITRSFFFVCLLNCHFFKSLN